MTDDQKTIEAMKDLLGTFHVIAQRERIRSGINDLLLKGLTAGQVLDAIKANPPVIKPQF